MLLVSKITGIFDGSEEVIVDINDPAILEGISESTVEIEGEVSGAANIVGEVSSHNEINVDIIASGPAGRDGLDAYEMWLEQGNEGSLEDFFNSLKGVDGFNYIHPDSHSADMIDETEERNFMTLREKEIALTTFIHDQVKSLNEWTVEHHLDKYPAVTVVDSSGNVVIGNIRYLTKDILTLSFTSEFSGQAYLN